MKRDPLDAVARIRRIAVDEARRALAASLQTETQARAALHEADSRITAEAAFASSLDADDRAVEAFGRWLPSGQAAVADARAAHDQAMARAAVERAHLAVTRAGAEAADKLLAKRQAAHAAEAEIRAQAALDEVAGRRRPTTG